MTATGESGDSVSYPMPDSGLPADGEFVSADSIEGAEGTVEPKCSSVEQDRDWAKADLIVLERCLAIVESVESSTRESLDAAKVYASIRSKIGVRLEAESGQSSGLRDWMAKQVKTTEHLNS